MTAPDSHPALPKRLFHRAATFLIPHSEHSDSKPRRGSEGASSSLDVKDAIVSSTSTLLSAPHALKHLRSYSYSGGRVDRPYIIPPSTSAPNGLTSVSRASLSNDNNDITNEPMEFDDIKVPALLKQGTPMLKVSAKQVKTRVFKLDPDQGLILWDSKKVGLVKIENIKEIRSGASSTPYLKQFKQVPPSPPPSKRWLTIIYTRDSKYKSLHLVPFTEDVFEMWNNTLRTLYAVREELRSGRGGVERREIVWERMWWRVARGFVVVGEGGGGGGGKKEGEGEGEEERVGFEQVEKMCRKLNIHSSSEDLLRRFQEADPIQSGYLPFSSFQRFVRGLKARDEVGGIYTRLVSSSEGGEFGFEVFEKFMRDEQKSDLSTEELDEIFQRYAGRPSSSSLSPDAFLSTPQSTTLSLSAIQQSPEPSIAPVSVSVSEQENITTTSPPTSWSLETFTSFLLSPTSNSPFFDAPHDMTLPLPEYFISSSHNTYLIGNQIVGDSTVEGYIRALLDGCRCVEIDIYDGEGEPVVYHRRTLTTKVSLSDIAQAIAKYAFVASPYPVIISAEIHCSIEQQDMIVGILKSVFGEMLVCAPLEGRRREGEELPSPEELRGRILVKAKNLYAVENEEMSGGGGGSFDAQYSSSTESAMSDVEPIKAAELQRQASTTLTRGLLARHVTSSSLRTTPTTADQSPTPPPSPNPKKMSPNLLSLLIYTMGVSCRGFNKKVTYSPNHVLSLSERTVNKFVKEGAAMDLVKHNRTHLSRVYPNGTRVNSSNFEPGRYWAVGAQLVAVNWQTFDLGHMINRAMFQRNGRTGYVVKPLALRTKDKTLLQTRTKHLLDVTIISAQQLPRPKDDSATPEKTSHKSTVDPFVEVSIHLPEWSSSTTTTTTTTLSSTSLQASPSNPTLPASSSTTPSSRTISHRTKIIKNNGFNPVWDEAMSIPFDCVGEMKDLVFVKFDVRSAAVDKDHSLPLAVYCTSLASLQQGYRHLPLHDQQMSQYLFSTLFVRTAVREV